MPVDRDSLTAQLDRETLAELKEEQGRYRITFDDGPSRITQLSVIVWVAQADPEATVTRIDNNDG